MTKLYDSKYFFNKIKKLQIIISRTEGYKSIEEMFVERDKSAELGTVNQMQGREK